MSYALVLQLADPAASCGAPNPDPVSAQLGPGTMLYEYDGGDPGYAAVAGSCGTNTFGAVLPGYTSSYSLAGFPANYLGPNSWIIRNLPGNWSNAAATFRIVGTLDLAPDASNTAYSRPIDIVQPMPVPATSWSVRVVNTPTDGSSNYEYHAGIVGSLAYEVTRVGTGSEIGLMKAWSYDPVSGAYTVLNISATPPSTVAAVAAGGAYDANNIYVVKGGYGGNKGTIAIYNMAGNSFSFPTAAGAAVTWPAAAVYGSSLYVFGGDTGAGFINSMEIWALPITAAPASLTPATSPVARRYATLTTIGTKLYLHGGQSSQTGFPVMADLWAFDTATQLWTQLASSPHARAMHAAGVINGKLYVTGGVSTLPSSGIQNATSSNLPVPSIDVFDPAAGTWTTEAAVSDGRAVGPSTFEFQSGLYMIGGTQTALNAQMKSIGVVWDGAGSPPTAPLAPVANILADASHWFNFGNTSAKPPSYYDSGTGIFTFTSSSQEPYYDTDVASGSGLILEIWSALNGKSELDINSDTTWGMALAQINPAAAHTIYSLGLSAFTWQDLNLYLANLAASDTVYVKAATLPSPLGANLLATPADWYDSAAPGTSPPAAYNSGTGVYTLTGGSQILYYSPAVASGSVLRFQIWSTQSLSSALYVYSDITGAGPLVNINLMPTPITYTIVLGQAYSANDINLRVNYINAGDSIFVKPIP